ncbi:MAG: PAS domain S-box protein [Thermoanaerobaculia bacterium]|nr:PAS domain S-box protein [Thermoanaerobaculia bacterium]
MSRSDDKVSLASPPHSWSVITIGIVACTIALVLAVAIYLLAVVPGSRSEATERWRRELELSADVRESALENWLADRMADARTIATYPSVVALLRGDPEAGAPGQLNAILADSAREHSIDAILVLGSAGLVASSSPMEGAVDPGCADLAARSASHRVGIVEFRVVRGVPRIVVGTPVRAAEPSQRVEGTVLLVIDPQRWVYGLVRLKSEWSTSAEALLVELEGNSVRFASPLQGRTDPPLTFRLPLDSERLAAAAALAGIEGFSRSVDYRGVPVLAVTRKLSNAPWGIVVKVDEAEVLREASARSRPIGVGLVLGALLAGLSVAILARAQGRAAREARRRGLERIALLLDATSDAVLFVARDGTILDANSAAERMYGRTRATLKELRVSELRAPGEEDRKSGEIDSADREGQIVFRARHVRRDGSPFPVEVSSRAAEIDGRAGFVLVVRDISDRIAAESRIDHLNRMLRTLSATNELILRATSHDEFLQEVCEIVVREARMPLAWIGEPEPDGSVTVVAAAGTALSYLDAVSVRWDDTAEGRGPAGTALREQRTSVVASIEAEAPAAWNDRALAAGLRSSFASPVSPAGRTDAVLCVCSGEIGFFVDEVRTLVEELATNVAFALELFEKREAQRETQDLIRAIVDRAPASIHVIDREARVTLWNPASERMFGWKADEVLGERLPIIAPGHEREFQERFERTLSGEPPPMGIVRRVRKDGSGIDLLMSVEALRDQSEAISGALAVAVDVTRAREFEQRASALFEAGVIGCLFGDIHGGIFDANDTFLEMIGYSRDELREGRIRWDAITPVEWLPLDAEKVEEAKRNGRCTPYEKEYVRKDGSLVSVVVGYRLLDPDRERSVAFILDVSELKREQRARRRAESALSAVFETPGLPIVIVDVKDGDLIHVECNAAYAERFGRSIQQVKGRSLGELGVNRTFIAEAIGRVRAVATSGKPEVFEAGVSDDARRYVISMAPLSGPSPSVARALLVMTDVTSLRVAEDELRRLNAELEQRVAARTEELLAANRELEAFSYSVSHDLRAPLRAIDGFSRIVEKEYGERLDDEGRRLLKVISNSTRGMGQLIDDLLAFSRAGRQPIRRERVPMAALANGAWLDIPRDQRAGIAFQLATLHDAHGDPALLRQVWHNLLTNAVKYSAPKSDRRIDVGSRNEDGKTIWFVCDNGVGFDMKYAATLFGVFQRLHSPSEFEGTGVGLAIVQRIVHRHGGEVWGEGEPGAGATFSFTLGA